MSNLTPQCPTCGQPLPAEDETEAGIIRDIQTAERQTFNRVQMSDLTGDPFHDWPLIVARFQNTLPWLVEVIGSDPTTARYLKGQKPVSDAVTPDPGPSQLWQDLDAIRPHLPKIVQHGQFTYGHQSRIAEALGVPNQGSYRRRIQNVVSALQRTLIKNSTSSTDSSSGAQENSTKNARAA